MKFKFCGNNDVPEWVAGEVATLSKISCVRMKLICKQVISQLLGGQIDFPKIQRLLPRDRGFSLKDIKAAVAAVRYILEGAAKHNVEFSTLSQELQQLGLPKENGDGVSRPYRNNRDLLVRRLRATSLSLPRVRGVDWRVDAVLASSCTPKQGSPAHQSIPGAAAPVPLVHLRVATTHGVADIPPPPPADRAVLAAKSRASASTAATPAALEAEAREAASVASSGLRALAAGVLSGSDSGADGGCLREAGATAAAGAGAPAVEFEGGRLGGDGRVLSLTMAPEKFRALHVELRRALEALEALEDGAEDAAVSSSTSAGTPGKGAQRAGSARLAAGPASGAGASDE